MNVFRYLQITSWAARRYTVNGMLVLSCGNKPSKYARIQQAAWQRYMGD